MTDPISLNDIPISELELSVRTHNVLQNAGVRDVRRLLELTKPEVMSWKNAGRRTWIEIADVSDSLRRPAEAAIALQDAVAAVNWHMRQHEYANLKLSITTYGLLEIYKKVI